MGNVLRGKHIMKKKMKTITLTIVTDYMNIKTLKSLEAKQFGGLCDNGYADLVDTKVRYSNEDEIKKYGDRFDG